MNLEHHSIFLLLLLLDVETFVQFVDSQRQPHIIFIYADDLGWNDVSFHGSPEIPTPNIDALAMNGVVLHNYYGEWMCTPSRGALMTGLHPIRLGLQHYVIRDGEASGLPLNIVTMPQHLKMLGYKTHMIGKWHLGSMLKAYTPTYRGFDTFFGYYNGQLNYYDYTSGSSGNPDEPNFNGIDLHNGTNVITHMRGKYATRVFSEEAERILMAHNPSKPLFLYLAHLAVHVGDTQTMRQSPPDVVRKFKYIKDVNRKLYAATASELDDSVGRIFRVLKRKGMLDNSIVVFASDNGGEVMEEEAGYASNYPLRGKKQTLWEGGVRLAALLWSPLLQLNEPRISTELMHVTDWLPTLYAAAGGCVADLGVIDGFSMWESLTSDVSSPRTALLYNIDPVLGVSAYRWGRWKVVNGTTNEGYNAWYGPTGLEDMERPQSMEKWVFKRGSTVRDILIEAGWWIVSNPDEWYRRLEVTCQQPPPADSFTCDARVNPCLFDVVNDPCEYKDLADSYPQILQSLMNMIDNYEMLAVEPQSKPPDPNADPMCHNFTYVEWLEPEYYVRCDYAE